MNIQPTLPSDREFAKSGKCDILSLIQESFF